MSLDDVVSSLKLICGPKPIQGSGTTDEAERIRWMLWALTDLDPIPTKHKTVLAVQNLGWNDSDRVLILYESQGL